MQWNVPRIWSGTVFIIGGGPSISKVNLSLLRGKRIIAINSAFEDVPFADFCYFMDGKWFEWNQAKLVHFSGVKITSDESYKDLSWVKFLKPKGNRLGLSIDDPGEICRGTNSGYGAIDIAVKLGGKRIVLLGYDMRPVSDDPAMDARIRATLEEESPSFEGLRFTHNYHARHQRKVDPIIYKNTYMAKGKGFDSLIAPALELGVEILNATPNSALKDFPIIDLKDVL